MKHSSLLSIAIFTYAASSCMEAIVLSDGTDTIKRRVSSSGIGSKKNHFCDINVVNKTNWTIQAKIRGFGVKDKDSELEEYELNTAVIDIASQKIHPFSILTATELPHSTTFYRLYAHALIIQFKNNLNNEIHFPQPIEANFRDFVVTSYDTDQGPRLKIESNKRVCIPQAQSEEYDQ